MYDWETVARVGSKATNPNEAEPIQLTAKVIHPRRLEVIEGAIFSTYIKPPFPREEVESDVLSWHSRVSGKSTNELLDLWYAAPEADLVFGQFIDFINRYHSDCKRKSIFSAPILCGHNILNYDNIIFNRLCERHGFVGKDGKQNVVMGNKGIDTLHLLWLWFENNPEITSLAFDNLRPYLGISTANAHDSNKDVDDCISIISRFLKFHRYTAGLVNDFKGKFNEPTA